MVMTKSATNITIYYSLFSVLSTVVNINIQMFFILTYKGLYSVEVSIFIGTLAGLLLYYFFEKCYIFSFQSTNIKLNGLLFYFNSFMGVFTTVIFWETEDVFYLIFIGDLMLYVGGVLGLVIGCYINDQLNKHFVFIDRFVKVVAI
jgi:hypothetical protein